MSDHAVVPAKLHRLRKHLKKLGFDQEPNNYNFIGIQWVDDEGLHFDNRLKKNLIKNIILKTDLPRITSGCICTQPDIKYNCIIRHVTEKYVLTIGNCCYKAMTDRNKDARKQMCSKEGCNERHQNIKYTVCNAHKKELIASLKLKKKDEKHQEMIKKLGEKEFGYGKRFRNTPIKDIPDWYFDWLYKNDIYNNRVADLSRYRVQTQIPK